MRSLKIVINKDTTPKVIKLNQNAIITLAFNHSPDCFNDKLGYNDLYINVSKTEIKQFEQDNINLIDRCIVRASETFISDHITYVIFCNNYTIMN